MTKHEELLLALVAATVDYDVSRCKLLLPVDAGTWTKVLELATMHGVTGLIFSAVEHLPKLLMPNMDTLLNMIGQTEYQKTYYKIQFETAQKFAKALKEKGVEMKVLKGISFSTYYDQPELRECSDCDCYLSVVEKVKESKEDKRNAGSTGFEIGNHTIEEIGGNGEFGSYKHSHLFLDNLMFENHHYITDFNGTKHGKVVELLLEKAIDSTPGTPIGKSNLVRPCAHFNALHLIRHAQGNFILEGMTLRMIYDWAVFLRAEQDNLDWKQLYSDYEAMGLRAFVDVMTSICVDYLGLSLTNEDITLCYKSDLVDAVLLDTIKDTIHMSTEESIWHKILRIAARYKRFWKYRYLAIESIPTMIWNSFAFSSYLKREITLKYD